MRFPLKRHHPTGQLVKKKSRIHAITYSQTLFMGWLQIPRKTVQLPLQPARLMYAAAQLQLKPQVIGRDPHPPINMNSASVKGVYKTIINQKYVECFFLCHYFSCSGSVDSEKIQA
jgi:hypothetical protein